MIEIRKKKQNDDYSLFFFPLRDMNRHKTGSRKEPKEKVFG